MKRLAILTLLGALAAAACGGPDGAPRRALSLTGSDTLLPLASIWAEAFEARHPGVRVYTAGGGTRRGFRMLMAGATDLALASRPPTPAELAGARARGRDLRAVPVARDAVVVIVHPANPVPVLTYPQLREIFTGRAGNWRAVGGPDRPLRAINTIAGSGTGRIFAAEVFGADASTFAPGGEVAPGNGLIYAAVAADPAAVGYVGYAFLTPRVRAVPLAPAPGLPPVAPTPENLRSGRYPMARSLSFYSGGPPSDLAQAFLDFCLGPEGQRLAREVGYLPLQAP